MQFEDVLEKPDPKEDLLKLIDPRLGDDYPFDSVHKVKSDSSRAAHLNSCAV